MPVTERITQLAEEVTQSEGIELVHVEFQPRGKSSVLRILIDKSGGVNLEDCQQVSRQLSSLLDVEDLIAHPYTLEVSSPGLDRPLFKLQDYERFQGRRAKVQTRNAINGRRNFKGEIRAVLGQTVVLADGTERFAIPFAEISRANLVFELRKTG